jgi:hypothetical protein
MLYPKIRTVLKNKQKITHRYCIVIGINGFLNNNPIVKTPQQQQKIEDSDTQMAVTDFHFT